MFLDLNVDDFQVHGQTISNPLRFQVQLLTAVVFMMQAGEMREKKTFIWLDKILEIVTVKRRHLHNGHRRDGSVSCRVAVIASILQTNHKDAMSQEGFII